VSGGEPPHLDRDVLARLSAAIGARALAEVVALFLTEAPRRIEQARDPERAILALHSLKSSAAMLGARQLEHTALELERAARERRSVDLAARLPELEAAWRALEPLLRALS
jgi:HPt (histidine-containing phosphotransfer) domain-containing protein